MLTNTCSSSSTRELPITKAFRDLSVEIWREVDGDVCHFWTVTKWDSVESIKGFAGEDYEKAKYYPEDGRYLLEFEPTVRHCETFEF